MRTACNAIVSWLDVREMLLNLVTCVDLFLLDHSGS